MSQIGKIASLLVLVCLTTAAAASDRIDPGHAFPQASELRHSFVPASASGAYQLRMVGTRFAAVFTPNGEPVAVFDLSLHHLSWSEVILGGIGFGDLNLLKLVKAVKKARKAGHDSNEIGSREELLKRGAEFFSGLRLTDDWAARNAVAMRRNDQKPGVPFQPGSSFTLADLQFKTKGLRERALKPFVKLAQLLYPEDGWNLGNIDPLAREIEFHYVDARPGYDIVWNRAIRDKKKEPKLPGIVVNYMNPIGNLLYKHTLFNLQRDTEYLRYRLGIYGILVDMVVSRISNGLVERLEYHERQLLGLMEAAERFEYQADLPAELIDVTLDMSYLSHYTSPSDELIVNGPGKRRRERADQEQARRKILKMLGDKKKDLRLTEMFGNKFAVARAAAGSGDGEGFPPFRGIYGTAIAPHAFFRYASLHVSAQGPEAKVVERHATQIAGFLGRDLLPAQLGFRIKNFTIGLYVEPIVYERFIRARELREQLMEGELAGIIDETIAGRATLPLTPVELGFAQQQLRRAFINPYELTLEEDRATIEKNKALLEKVLGSDDVPSHFTPEAMIPFVM